VDPSDTETVKNLNEKITETTRAAEEEKALADSAGSKAETFIAKADAEKKTSKDLAAKNKNLEKKKEAIEKQAAKVNNVKGKGKKVAA